MSSRLPAIFTDAAGEKEGHSGGILGSSSGTPALEAFRDSSTLTIHDAETYAGVAPLAIRAEEALKKGGCGRLRRAEQYRLERRGHKAEETTGGGTETLPFSPWASVTSVYMKLKSTSSLIFLRGWCVRTRCSR